MLGLCLALSTQIPALLHAGDDDLVTTTGAAEFNFKTPLGKTTGAMVVTAKSVSTRNAVYIQHDLDLGPKFRKVDLRGNFIDATDLVRQCKDLYDFAKMLNDKNAHRYIGKVGTTDKNPHRSLDDRIKEHAKASNKDYVRFYRGLHNTARSNKKVFVQALIVNSHPDQLNIIEAYIIGLFEGVGSLGWNSNAGAQSRLKIFDEGLSVRSIQYTQAQNESYDETSADSSSAESSTESGTQFDRLVNRSIALFASPESKQAKNTAYLVHETSDEFDTNEFTAINFHFKPLISLEDLASRTQSLLSLAENLIGNELHRYIGRTACSNLRPDRNFEDRIIEHQRGAQHGNSRFYLFLGNAPRQPRARALVYNVPAFDLPIIEAYLIGLFRSNEEHGCNGNSGSQNSLKQLLDEAAIELPDSRRLIHQESSVQTTSSSRKKRKLL